MSSNILIGKIGEQIAQKLLINKGITIVERNFRTKCGEIDIIGEKNNKLYFVEVKTRIGDAKGKPYEAVNYRKIMHIKKAAQLYVLKNNKKNCKLSLQVISIELTSELKEKSVAYFEDVLL